MKIALVTTTINAPHVLKLYRAYGPDVRFFVAADIKTPPEAYNLCELDMDGVEIFHPIAQRETDPQGKYKCSELLGWNTIARRNIATLEALKWGADILVFIDDDNIPLDEAYFEQIFWHPNSNYFSGILASSPSGWFDVGMLLDPTSPHRGFPHAKATSPVFSHITAASVGVAAGIALGDPDISAITRISRAPVVHRVSELLHAGVVVDPRQTWTVFNSQNTAVIRELAPAFFMIPQFGRFDDIFASLVVQRLMRERNLHVHFGKPFVWQQRNEHCLVKDLKAEIMGEEFVAGFAEWLNGFHLSIPNNSDNEGYVTGPMTICNSLRILFTNLPDFIPERTKVQELALAWIKDVESVL